MLCSNSSSGTVVNLNDITPKGCIHFPSNFGVRYKCFNGKWTVSACDNTKCESFSYYEFSEIYCVGLKSKKMCN